MTPNGTQVPFTYRATSAKLMAANDLLEGTYSTLRGYSNPGSATRRVAKNYAVGSEGIAKL